MERKCQEVKEYGKKMFSCYGGGKYWTINLCRCRCRDRKGQLATHPVSKTVLKEVRRNRFPYKLRVGEDEERPGEL